MAAPPVLKSPVLAGPVLGLKIIKKRIFKAGNLPFSKHKASFLEQGTLSANGQISGYTTFT